MGNLESLPQWYREKWPSDKWPPEAFTVDGPDNYDMSKWQATPPERAIIRVAMASEFIRPRGRQSRVEA